MPPSSRYCAVVGHMFVNSGDNTSMLKLIGFYQRWISPLLPPRCRFYPSCSAYAAEAFECHGTMRGGWLAFKRVCSCHPFHPGGYDPVPDSDTATNGINPGCHKESDPEQVSRRIP